ncbi:Glycogen debranching protein [uncultured spirochete]|uniref:Glycogen debranching protein n=1 Tax=uncultured spirochete TaxID=156406 RepID=A0A3P3XR56_9SPIR|nr:Glycogen debranching protein [uncultured spirochete]
MKKSEFFSRLPAMDAQFGNLILIRDKADRKDVPGAQECFLSSVVQFQPLARLGICGPAGAIPLAPVSSSSDPIRARKVFEGGGLRLFQELVVSGDEASLALKIEKMGEGGGGPSGDTGRSVFTLTVDGACLFSPQGVPYHWRDESLLSVRRAGGEENGLDGEWSYGRLPFSLRSSAHFDNFKIRRVADDEIIRTHYFTSFNLKKRYTYWVEAEGGTSAGAAPSADSTVGNGASPVTARNVGYEASIDLGDLREAREIVLAFGIGGAAEKTEASAGRHAELIRGVEADWDGFLEGVPEFRAGDKALERMYCTSWFILKANRVHFDDPRFPYPFTSVNKHHYYNQFFWDSAYQAIAWLWYNRAEPAQDELRNFVTNQWRNGMIPYELFMYPVNGREWMDGDGTSTGMTQPPVIGIALSEIYKKYGSSEYLRFFYEPLLRYEDWLTLYRDLGKRGLSCYLNIWETGWDNSPRLDASARNRVLDPAIESADFNAYIYYMRRTILEMAAALGEKVPPRVSGRMEATKRAMNTLMYDVADGFYHDVVAGTDERIPVKTAAGLIPLVTDIPDRAARGRIVAEYVESEKEFMTGCPVPSVSRSEPTYNPVDFWRGANWPQITWTVIFSLADSHPEAAGEILRRFLASTKGNSTCYEYYDAETGKGAGMPFQGWGALYTDMIMRFVAGIIPENAGMRFHPLSAEIGDFSVDNVRLKDLALDIGRRGDTWTFAFHGFGGFAMEGVHEFRALPSADGARLKIKFGPGCDRNLVMPLPGENRLEFRFV